MNLAKACIFCGRTGSLTAEHIWGAWTKKYVVRTANKHASAQIYVSTPGQPGEPKVKIRAGDPLDANAPIVCSCCNSGWMSEIQNRAKPYLIPLFQGRQCEVAGVAQTAISSWLAMATMTGEHSGKGTGVGVSQDQRDWLMRTKTAPPTFRIWIGRHRIVSPQEQWIHVSFPISNTENLPPVITDQDRLPNSQTTAFTIGELFFFVMSTPFKEINEGWDWRTARRARARLVQIWPDKYVNIFWPPPVMSDDDARSIGKAIMTWLDGVAQRSGDR